MTATDRRRGRRLRPGALAAVVVLLGLVGLAVRLDGPDDKSLVTEWLSGGVRIDTWSSAAGRSAPTALTAGDVVTSVGDARLADGDRVARPAPGQTLTYGIVRGAEVDTVPVAIGTAEAAPLLSRSWGNLVFVCSLALLATALYLRRPGEPTTTPLLIASACLFGSTLVFSAGIPALAVATGGSGLWLCLLNVLAVYSVGWGAVVAFAVDLSGVIRRRRRMLIGAYALGPAGFAAWLALALVGAADLPDWLGRVFFGQTVLVAASLLATAVLAVLGYVRSTDPLTRDRLRWVALGGCASAVVGLVGWHLPTLITGQPLFSPGAIGLSGLPFVAGLAIALRRHRLFDIERLANRSLIAITLVAAVAAGYAVLVALLVTGLGLSGTAAAAIAAAAAALALAPLRTAVERGINRLMYGDRDDPSAVLARLGTRMQAAMLPDEVPPAVVETVAQSLRLPYVAIDIADDADDFQVAAELGVPAGAVHVEPLTHHGLTIGRLRVSDRGRDDPLEGADLDLIRSLAREVGPAVEAVRLHRDLLQSRAEAVALREDERRRLRRDLHDGLGPTLAAIGLKAALAARELPQPSEARTLLDEIEAEARTSLGDIRRLVEALRPPALDELGLIGALRSRAHSLAGEVAIDVSGSLAGPPLPAAAETAAYRIAVEAMTNSIRHSGARSCGVDVRSDDVELTLEVRDDGHGLAAGGPPGVGLRSMRERAEEVGGRLLVTSTPAGTTVSARLPLGQGVSDLPTAGSGTSR